MTAARAAAGTRPRRRAAAAQARRDAPARPRAADHREDAAVGTRGAAAHPGRGRDHRPRRLQRPDPAEDRRVPGHQDPGGVRPRARPRSPAPPWTTSPRWNGSRARENLCLVGPAGTGKSHLLVALGVAAVQAGHKVRYFTAAELVETLYRGLADNSVGRVIDTLLRNDLIIIDEVGFAPLDDTGAQLLFRFVAAAYERRALGIASHWPFEPVGPVPARAHHRRQPARPAAAPRQRRRHRRRLLPHARSPSPRRNHPNKQLINPRDGDF